MLENTEPTYSLPKLCIIVSYLFSFSVISSSLDFILSFVPFDEFDSLLWKGVTFAKDPFTNFNFSTFDLFFFPTLIKSNGFIEVNDFISFVSIVFDGGLFDFDGLVDDSDWTCCLA